MAILASLCLTRLDETNVQSHQRLGSTNNSLPKHPPRWFTQVVYTGGFGGHGGLYMECLASHKARNMRTSHTVTTWSS